MKRISRRAKRKSSMIRATGLVGVGADSGALPGRPAGRCRRARRRGLRGRHLCGRARRRRELQPIGRFLAYIARSSSRRRRRVRPELRPRGPIAYRREAADQGRDRESDQNNDGDGAGEQGARPPSRWWGPAPAEPGRLRSKRAGPWLYGMYDRRPPIPRAAESHRGLFRPLKLEIAILRLEGAGPAISAIGGAFGVISNFRCRRCNLALRSQIAAQNHGAADADSPRSCAFSPWRGAGLTIGRSRAILMPLLFELLLPFTAYRRHATPVLRSISTQHFAAAAIHPSGSPSLPLTGPHGLASPWLADSFSDLALRSQSRRLQLRSRFVCPQSDEPPQLPTKTTDRARR